MSKLISLSSCRAINQQRLNVLNEISATGFKAIATCLSKSAPAAYRRHRMRKQVSRFVKDESGATAIEYGLIAAGISVAIIAVVNGIGTKIQGTFTSISSQLK